MKNYIFDEICENHSKILVDSSFFIGNEENLFPFLTLKPTIIQNEIFQNYYSNLENLSQKMYLDKLRC